MPRTARAQCDGRPIRRITIVSDGVFTDRDSRIPGFLQTLGSALHTTTKRSTVESDLLFRPGEPCDAEHLAETERLLRAEPYIRSAQVNAYEATGDSVDLEVRTQDEWSLRGSAWVENGGPHGAIRRLRIVESNVAGRGLLTQLRLNNDGRHPGFDAELQTRRLLGHLTGDVQLGNSGVGPIAEQSILRQFNSEFDRMAWREAMHYRKQPFTFQAPAVGSAVLPIVSAEADFGAARRFGRPGALALLGGLLSFERLFPEGGAFAGQAADDSLVGAVLDGRYTERRRLRIHGLLGVRSLKFVQRDHVDAVNATEDIRTGFEGGLIAGRSLFGGQGLQHDRFGALELYLGAAPGERALLFLRGKWEGRREAAGFWSDVIASGDLIAYRMTSSMTTYAVGVSAAGGWNTTAPFQMTLGGPSGIRGYGGAALPVGQRVVIHASRRHFAGVLFGAVDVGTTLFVDLGQGWAGDVPFGVNTGVVGSLGGGLRLAFPSGSRVTYRLDVAAPVHNGHGLEIRFGLGQQFGISRGEAEDVARSREQVSSTTVFNFPRF